ncbi:hypothetical protein K2173_006564 [Erythroxylum novogranatense]|uniref:Transcription repressor n=1 Tax=Erythroxylum novogranatense TaxID=1862640 RepID=A0AAV8T5A3_9ROSI|nr:hypothetical protein K2173_006564 [Erythroxylum novogranatense]
MKWGRKKPTSPSSFTRPSLMSHVLPSSWLTKFKQISVNPEERRGKTKKKGKWKHGTTNSPQLVDGGGGGRFYRGEGDDFWRLSFGDDGFDSKRSRGILTSVVYDSEDEPGFAPSSYQTCRSNAPRATSEDNDEFVHSACGLRKMRNLTGKDEIFPEMITDTRGKVAEIRSPRLRLEEDKIFGKTSQKFYEEKAKEFNVEDAPHHEAESVARRSVANTGYEAGMSKTREALEKRDCEFPTYSYSRENCYLSPVNSKESYPRETDADSKFADAKECEDLSSENLNCEWQNLKAMKIEELKPRGEKQRKSMYISRELQSKRPKDSSGVRVHSPRRAEICKVKAIEDMRKAKFRTRKKKKTKKQKASAMGLESFAVVTFSMDPQNDFRESMMEMIQEKGINRPEELEELLACYLTLNTDEYHSLIIQVFRQVWVEQKQASYDYDSESESEQFLP